jgi:hypothetical protein
VPRSETYRRGDRVELVATADEHTRLTPGSHGTVMAVDSAGTVHVLWDNGATLGMVLDQGDDIRLL